MGQQQLLLVILVTIIVGIATVVAINVFGTSAENANLDAVRQDLLTAATAAQGWYIKPAMLGGGGQDFAGVTLADLGIPFDRYDEDNTTPGTSVTNANALYTLSGADGDVFTITATPTNYPALIILNIDMGATTPEARVAITEADLPS